MGAIELFGGNDWNHDFPRVCRRETKRAMFVRADSGHVEA
jgi:hypothetical protein